MKSPIRRILRVVVVLLTAILLFNFLGYYLLNQKSKENQEIAKIVSVVEKQQLLSKLISKNSLIILNGKLNKSDSILIIGELEESIKEFSKGRDYLFEQIQSPLFTSSADGLKVKRILSNPRVYSKSILIVSG